MIGFAALSLLVVDAQIPTTPLRSSEARSRPAYQVVCDLWDVKTQQKYQIALAQSGGRYVYEEMPKGNRPAGRQPTFVQFTKDDLGIFGSEQHRLDGQVTDWYSDGPIEMISYGKTSGGLTLYKTVKGQAFLHSPATIAVNGKAGRYVPANDGERSLEELLLTGSCTVTWEKQEIVIRSPERDDQDSNQ